MPVLDVQQVNGETLGYDTDRGEWVPVDPNAAQGGFLGNAAAAAGRGSESLMYGTQQLLGSNPEQAAAGAADVGQRQEAAGRAAPWAEMLGGAAPDVAASIGLAATTGPLGLAATMGGEGALNAMLGFLKPGDMEQRITSALAQGAIGSVGGAVGVGAGHAATAMFELFKPAGQLSKAAVHGAMQGANASEALTSKQLGSIGAELERGGAAIRAADESGAGAGTVEGGLPGGGQGRSVGAAETPQGQIDPRTQVEGEVYAADDAAQMDVNNPQRQVDIRNAEDLGFTFNPGSYTKAGSGARTLEAINQAAPWREAMGMRNEAANQVLLNKSVAKAIGMRNWEQADVISPNDIGMVDAGLANTFQKIEAQLPHIETRKYVDMLKGIDQSKGLAGSNEAQDLVAQMIGEAQRRGIEMPSNEYMADRSVLNAIKTKMFNQGDTTGGEAIGKVIDGLDKVIDKKVKGIGNRKVMYTWQTARQQYRMLQQIQSRGAISPTGDVNATTLFNNMNRKPSAGGYGNMDIQGRVKGDAVRDSYVLANAQRINHPNRPATGLMRIPAEAIKAATSKAGATAIGGGAAGTAILNSIWGR